MKKAPRDNSPSTIFGCRCIAAATKEIRVRIDESKLVWVPLNVVHADSEIHGAGDSGKLVVSAWWATQELELGQG
jgi:hypothetical protein